MPPGRACCYSRGMQSQLQSVCVAASNENVGASRYRLPNGSRVRAKSCQYHQKNLFRGRQMISAEPSPPACNKCNEDRTEPTIRQHLGKADDADPPPQIAHMTCPTADRPHQ